ncbi:uncharacterized protein in LEU2 3'region-like [Mastacembelus armatus]|uniref:uncharacterized protein in LEU2 3'region-like n=1 Tax=Mastacembelus armatus TaxID=205130 RepID=UPI000E4547D2|nr:uncharacterized protein in LEU2 3'region-like [Mastacembelus armatus]
MRISSVLLKVNIASLTARDFMISFQDTYFLILWQSHNSVTMQVNLTILTLCIFGTVVLCGALTQTTLPPAIMATTELEPTSTKSNGISITPGPSTTLTTATTGPSGPTTAATTNQSTTSSATHTRVSSSAATVQSEITISKPVEESSSEGLSSGAIAGITIGSIAGVAVLGGGVFGALKYTGRL